MRNACKYLSFFFNIQYTLSMIFKILLLFIELMRQVKRGVGVKKKLYCIRFWTMVWCSLPCSTLFINYISNLWSPHCGSGAASFQLCLRLGHLLVAGSGADLAAHRASTPSVEASSKLYSLYNICRHMSCTETVIYSGSDIVYIDSVYHFRYSKLINC